MYFKFNYEGVTYHGLEDFIKRFDVEKHQPVDENGVKMNPYEFYWKMFKDQMVARQQKAA